MKIHYEYDCSNISLFSDDEIFYLSIAKQHINISIDQNHTSNEGNKGIHSICKSLIDR